MNQKELKELIEFLIEKDIAEFELERGDVKVRIRRAGEPASATSLPDTRYFAMHPAPTAPQIAGLRDEPNGGFSAAGGRCARRAVAHCPVADRGYVL